MAPLPDTIEIYILAGGRSSRMGSDKGLVSFLGKPLVQHVLDAVKNGDVPVSLVTHHTYSRHCLVFHRTL